MRGWKKGGAPLWAAACQMSEVWGVPPWVIWSHPGSARWVNRMQVYRAEAEAARRGESAPSLVGAAPDDISWFNGDIPVAVMRED